MYKKVCCTCKVIVLLTKHASTKLGFWSPHLHTYQTVVPIVFSVSKWVDPSWWKWWIVFLTFPLPNEFLSFTSSHPVSLYIWKRGFTLETMLLAPLTNNPARLFVEKAEMSSKKGRRRVGKGDGERGWGKGWKGNLTLSSFFRAHYKFLNELARNRWLDRLPTSSLQRNILILLEFISIVFCMNNAGGKAGF